MAVTGQARASGAVAGDGLPELSGSAPSCCHSLNDRATLKERSMENFLCYSTLLPNTTIRHVPEFKWQSRASTEHGYAVD